MRRSRQRCGVELVANAEQLSRIDAVLRIERETPGLHGPLNSRTSHITDMYGCREGKLGHGYGLSV